MFKKRLLALLVACVFVLAMSGVGQATVATKQISVNYSNIKLVVDGKQIGYSAAQEPFILGGVTYVPLRLAAEALNSDVNWQGATKTINISGGSSVEVNTLKMQLEQKNNENASLKAQITSLQNQLDNCKDDLKDRDNEEDDFDDLIDEIEDDLNDDNDFESVSEAVYDVDVDKISVSGNYDDEEVKVTINVDLSGTQQDEWDKLSNRAIEDFIDDVIDYIQDELDDEDFDEDDFEISGKIYDTEDKDTLVKFNRDGNDDTDFDW